MTIREAYDLSVYKLGSLYDKREGENITSILFEDIFGINNPNKEGPFEQTEKLTHCMDRLLKGEPIQYVVGSTIFFGYRYKVNKNVLIPRPETEELVAWVLEDHKTKKNQIDVLDIGTGSGCIGVTLGLSNPRMRIFGVEYSLDALNVARINAKRHMVNMEIYRINFLDTSLWAHLGKFDVIVSNPPYISRAERIVMADNVLLYEPELALFLDSEDHLSFYKAIAQFGKEHLKNEALIYVELNENYVDQIQELYENDYVHIQVKKDLQGKPRMLRAQLIVND